MGTRVWDAFLTEQDRALLNKSPRRPVGFGHNPALLLIDLYRWVFGDKPEPLLDAVDTWPGSCGPAAWEAAPHIQKLLGKAREIGMPIVHVAGVGKEACINIWNVTEAQPSTLTPEILDRQRRRFDIIDELKPLPGETFIRKSSPSAFWGTPLAGHLNALHVDTVITCGESTSGCVRASVVDGCTYRYRVIIAEECVFDRTQASHAINLFDMHQKYADVLPLSEIVSYLDSRRDR